MNDLVDTRWFDAVKRYWQWGFNVVSIGTNKQPNAKEWRQWEHQRQRWNDDVGAMPWQYATGMAGICGKVSGGLVNIDIDDVDDTTALQALVVGLGLPFDYPWQVRSGSGRGYHAWFFSPDLKLPGDVGKLKFPGVHGGKIELRYTGHYTILPPSQHPTGAAYAFLYDQPTQPPARIAGSDLQSIYKTLVMDKAEPAKPEKVSSVANVTPKPASRKKLSAREQVYINGAVRGECDKLNNTPAEEGNDQLYESALKLGGYVKAGLLSQSRFEYELMKTDVAKRRPEIEARRSIASGLENAKAKVIPDPPENYNGNHSGKTINLTTLPDDPPDNTSGNNGGNAGKQATPPDDLPALNLTDMGNAERLIFQHGGDLLYCQAWKGWLVWDGTRWKRDESNETERRAKMTVRTIPHEIKTGRSDKHKEEIAKHALRSESAQRIEAMIRLARSEPSVIVKPDEFDANAMLLNCQNYVIDLTTGQPIDHERNHRHMKQAQAIYDPAAKAPIWEAFLHKIMGGNQNLINFIQRAIGYSLTGSTSEQVVFFLHGKGSNGKSTFLEILRHLLADYSLNTPTSTLMRKKDGNGINNDVARLLGARLVTAIETDENQYLSEATVKSLTGGDTITARYLYSENFDFKPICKIWLACNHKPVITGVDNGIWRRIRLIPFTVTIAEHEKDMLLPQKLQNELSGILNWALRGCLEWQKEGLGAPSEVINAVNQYRNEMDSMASFIEETCVKLPTASVASSSLYAAYQKWAIANGEIPMSPKMFGGKLTDRGFEKRRGGHNGSIVWAGIGLRATEPSE